MVTETSTGKPSVLKLEVVRFIKWTNSHARPPGVGLTLNQAVPEVISKHLVKKQSKEKELSYDVFKHELVPKHILLKPSETKDVLDRYHIKPFQIPYIKSTDPAVRAIGAKPGDIVKVVRKSATAGESDFYRYVVEDF